jgi:hypothetical protein
MSGVSRKVVSPKAACLSLLAASALFVAACGGSSSSSTQAPRPPVQAAHHVAPIPQFLGNDKVQASSSRPVKARPPAPGTDDDEVNSTGAKPVNPCALVSRAEAQTIIGAPVAKAVEAPQGPTCVYSPQGAKSLITLAVESMHFSKIQPQAQLRDRISVTIHGHTAYCGVVGTPTMIVPLPAGKYLSVTAPCPIAASFAAKALSHIA